MIDPAAAHVFVETVAAPELNAADSHHLLRVLRVRTGERVSVSDGAGAWRLCRLAPGGVLAPDGGIVHEPEPVPRITIGFTIIKGDRPEWIVQKLTEVGVDRIVPLVSTRSVVRWDDERRPRHLERLRRVAREAAMQSRRARLPEVTDVLDLTDGSGGASASLGRSAAFVDPGGDPPSLDWPVLFVGPEGGWEPEELRANARRVNLGPTVLRAETAAVCAAFVLSALRAGLVEPGQPSQ